MCVCVWARGRGCGRVPSRGAERGSYANAETVCIEEGKLTELTELTVVTGRVGLPRYLNIKRGDRRCTRGGRSVMFSPVDNREEVLTLVNNRYYIDPKDQPPPWYLRIQYEYKVIKAPTRDSPGAIQRVPIDACSLFTVSLVSLLAYSCLLLIEVAGTAQSGFYHIPRVVAQPYGYASDTRIFTPALDEALRRKSKTPKPTLTLSVPLAAWSGDPYYNHSLCTIARDTLDTPTWADASHLDASFVAGLHGYVNALHVLHGLMTNQQETAAAQRLTTLRGLFEMAIAYAAQQTVHERNPTLGSASANTLAATLLHATTVGGFDSTTLLTQARAANNPMGNSSLRAVTLALSAVLNTKGRERHGICDCDRVTCGSLYHVPAVETQASTDQAYQMDDSTLQRVTSLLKNTSYGNLPLNDDLNRHPFALVGECRRAV